MKSKGQKSNQGIAAIVLVLVVSIVVILFTHVSVLSFQSAQVTTEHTDGEFIQMKAEGYLENAAIRYLRSGAYTGEVLNEGEYTCTIVVTDIGGLDRDFESTCTRRGRTRTVGMQATYASGIFTFSPVEQR